MGLKGSVRLDAVQYDPNGQILQIFDLKTGNGAMSASRIQQIYSHLPQGQNGPIVIIRP